MSPRAIASVLVALALAGAADAATAPAVAPAQAVPVRAGRPSAPNPAPIASEARTREDEGAYGLALEQLRRLRPLVPLDGDLELATAIDEARANLLDSAWVRLEGPVLRAALADEGGPGRWRDYPFQREPFWLNGRFDGWYWYVARTKAEVALRLGRWADARDAAKIAVHARPLAGKEHLLYALCLAHTGDESGARTEARLAAELDPLLPEGFYLRGLVAWRDGDRARAREDFERALARDSSYRAPALALSRLLVPGLAPDPLPTRFLSGRRRAAELTSRVRPKLEEYVQFDQIATLYGQPRRVVPDSLKAIMGMTRPIHLYVTVLVDEHGRVVSDELPWLTPKMLPVPLLVEVLHDASRWKFKPAVKLGRPRASYATVEYELTP